MKQVTRSLRGAARRARGPVLATGAAAAAVAGGAVLKRQLAPKRRKILCVPLPTPNLDGLVPSGGLDFESIGKGISNAGKRVGKASQQLAKLSDDVERVGKTTQKLGDTLS